jgi:hypothetical protein
LYVVAVVASARRVSAAMSAFCRPVAFILFVCSSFASARALVLGAFMFPPRLPTACGRFAVLAAGGAISARAPANDARAAVSGATFG